MYEMLVGLEVVDDKGYNQYRQAMRPVLERFNGEFGYDFKVAEVLKAEENTAINRVFTIRFPDEQTKEQFFADPQYQAAKLTFFEISVASTTLIASYER